MKANELMIGDWVMLCGHNVKICSVNLYIGDGDTMAGQHYVLTDPQVGFSNSWVSLLKPIPITPEILEKNGWNKENESRLYVDNNNVMIANVEKHFEITKSWQRHYNRLETIAINIRYLHELQHALRMCGIEKEIVL